MTTTVTYTGMLYDGVVPSKMVQRCGSLVHIEHGMMTRTLIISRGSTGPLGEDHGDIGRSNKHLTVGKASYEQLTVVLSPKVLTYRGRTAPHLVSARARIERRLHNGAENPSGPRRRRRHGNVQHLLLRPRLLQEQWGAWTLSSLRIDCVVAILVERCDDSDVTSVNSSFDGVIS